ncbi:hypothetical protein GPJ56_000671 [Histomonas meleagridis]|uniref:uncharacterized protein n=1 Tax=Histomonas meleagridis TaxID=135588 RepID=UPI00355A0C73|nr:hypothetical protein GPJ56_000671 [Histomonas meleagridis]KAH0804800.1 hypothetical protein GO595_002494 [Histomonas meleagridis]
MRSRNTRTRPLVAPIKFVKGGENLDVANSILRAEMKSTPTKKSSQSKKSNSKKSAAARSSKRRSASIERIFEKKKVEEDKKHVDILKQQLSQLKEREIQLTRASRAMSVRAPPPDIQQRNNKNLAPRPVSNCFSKPTQPATKENVVRTSFNLPVQSKEEPKKSNSTQIPNDHTDNFIMNVKSNLRKVTPVDRSSIRYDDNKDDFSQIISQTMAARRKCFAPESDSSSNSDDETEQTEF